MLNFLGRYTAIITTTIVFVVLVVGVLGVNFNLSFQTEANAEVVNIAGRQRMLSQRVAKSLANVKAKALSDEPYSKPLDELQTAAQLFNRTLLAFKQGGPTLSTKSGQTYLEPVSGSQGEKAVYTALQIWQPMNGLIEQVINQLGESNEQASLESAIGSLTQAQEYADSNINRLLKVMNDLTNHTESLANDAADKSRLIQSAGILASLLCFAIIMYLILGQLRASDMRASMARRETKQIFETVDQGLFLVDKDLRMGSEHSKALESIFFTDKFENKSFTQFIGGLVSASDLDKVKRYLDLLFDPHKKQRLLTDLNPLKKLAIQVEEFGQPRTKFLNFSFSRVFKDNQIVSVLSSVSDITKEVTLANELELETRRNQQQLEMMLALMGADSDMLPEFLASSHGAYANVNELLKGRANSALEFREKADAMMPLIHKVKGDSAALGLEFISQLCHQFEDKVQIVMNKRDPSGDDFLSLTVTLEQLISTNQQISSIFDAIAGSGISGGSAGASEAETGDSRMKLMQLAETVSQRQGKKVNLSIAGFDEAWVPAKVKLDVVSLASQLLRNAISHGIETPAERVGAGKSELGQVTLALYSQGAQGFRLVCEDDGGGVDFDLLEEKAIAQGLLNPEAGGKITPNRLVNLMLTNALSSKSEADEDAGRGVGLSVAGELVSKLNGKLALSTKPSIGTRFSVRFTNFDKGSNAQEPMIEQKMKGVA